MRHRLALAAVVLLGGCASFRASFKTVPAATLVEPEPEKAALVGFRFDPQANKLSILDEADGDLLLCVPSSAYHTKDGQSCTALRDVRFYLESRLRAN